SRLVVIPGGNRAGAAGDDLPIRLDGDAPGERARSDRRVDGASRAEARVEVTGRCGCGPEDEQHRRNPEPCYDCANEAAHLELPSRTLWILYPLLAKSTLSHLGIAGPFARLRGCSTAGSGPADRLPSTPCPKTSSR